MMDKERIAQAMLDPQSVFQVPSDVVSEETLTKVQKVEILRRWEYDACEVSVAEEEGMPVQDGETLNQILLALHELVGDLDSDKTPPTKQGGLGREAVRKSKRKP